MCCFKEVKSALNNRISGGCFQRWIFPIALFRAEQVSTHARIMTLIVGVLIGMGVMALFFLVKWWASPW
jgi:hypothetical protein